jgi:tetratricopeptide (TPR) repeat protein
MTLIERTAKINALAIPALGLLGAASWFQPAAPSPDLFGRLAAGRALLATGSIPTRDPFSFAQPEAAWLNHSWLADALYWNAYRLDPGWVVVLQLALLGATFGLLYAACARTASSRLGAAVALWLGAATAHWFLAVGSGVFGLLGLAALLALRERPWAPYAWPGIALLWVNLDASFALGLGAIALDAGCRVARDGMRVQRVSLASLLVCGLVVGLNPAGYAAFGPGLAQLPGSGAYRDAALGVAAPFSLDPRGFAGRFYWLCFAALGAAGLTRRRLRRNPYPLLLAVSSAALALTARQFIPLFAIGAAPLVALGIARLADKLRAWRGPVPASAVWAGLALAALATVLLWRGVDLRPSPLARWTQADLYPQAAVRYLKALGPPERILNTYHWGGYVLLQLPGVKVFSDARGEAVYSAAVLADLAALERGSAGARARLAHYRPDVALVSGRSGTAAALQAGSEPWVRIYADVVADILVPGDSPLLVRRPPSPEARVGAEPQFALTLARGSADRGDPERALALTQQVIASDPLLVAAYGQLAELHADQGNADGIAAAIAAGLAANPRRARELRELEGLAYERAGMLPLALRAYRQSLPAGPYRSDAARRASIRRVDDQLAGR